MNEINYRNLPHLNNMIPKAAYSSKINTFTIALEGWRRGLKLNIYSDYKENRVQLKYALTSKERTCYFEGSRGDKVSKKTIDICINKEKTNKILSKSSVPIPKGKHFHDNVSEKEIMNFASEIGYPVVLKPTNASLGRGVVTNIKSESELHYSLDYVRNTLKYPDIIVEKYLKGEDYRVYVIDGTVIAAIKRVPAYVTGDGKSTIEDLVQMKNKFRQRNPNLYYRPIKLDDEAIKILESRGLNNHSILEKGRILNLKEKSNISTGGDSIDMTKELPKNIKEIAIKASQAVNAVQCGVDLIVNNNDAFVIEVNSKAHIGGHMFPYKGMPRDVPKAIIDYYFPETIDTERYLDQLTFDYSSVIKLLKNRNVSEVIIPPHPNYQVEVKSYRINQHMDNSSINSIVRKCNVHKINGFIRKKSQNIFLLVLANEDLRNKKAIEILNNENINPNELNARWNKSVSLGFKYIKGQNKNYYSRQLKKLQRDKKLLSDTNESIEKLLNETRNLLKKEIDEKKNYKEKIHELKKDKEYYIQKSKNLEDSYESIINSKSWKITSPLRKVIRYFEKTFN